jgi:pyruvate dehydrogenase (quinone)
MVKLEMEVAGIPDRETEMMNPDFTKIAEAMGMNGITISEPDEVKSGLEKALLHEGPVLVTIQTDPNALAMPPKLEFEQMKGMALYMEKMMLGGRMDEAFNIISSNYKHLSELL